MNEESILKEAEQILANHTCVEKAALFDITSLFEGQREDGTEFKGPKVFLDFELTKTIDSVVNPESEEDWLKVLTDLRAIVIEAILLKKTELITHVGPIYFDFRGIRAGVNLIEQLVQHTPEGGTKVHRFNGEDIRDIAMVVFKNRESNTER